VPLVDGVLGQEGDEGAVLASQHAAEEDQPELLGDPVRRRSDVDQHRLAVCDQVRASCGDGVLPTRAHCGHLGKGIVGAEDGKRATVDPAHPSRIGRLLEVASDGRLADAHLGREAGDGPLATCLEIPQDPLEALVREHSRHRIARSHSK